MITRLSLCLAPLLLLACANETSDAPQTAQGLCFSGGTILTGQGRAEAVATDGNMIAYVGADEGDWCPAGARRVDLAEHVMMPGLVDAHAHLIGIGLREMTLNLEGTESISDLRDRLRDAAMNAPAGETLYGRGWIETHWPEDRFPTRDDIDDIISDRPVLIERADGHAMVVNSRALELAGIDADTPVPDGGAIRRDDQGRLTGMLVDNAMALVADLQSELDEPTRRRALKTGAELYASRGWTGIHNMSVPPENVALLEALDAAGELPIRVYNSLDTRELDRVIDADPSDKVTTRAIKLYGDGALGSRGAALLEPYADDPGNEGLMTLTSDILPLMREAGERGVQVNTHAIGDKANRAVLDWYQDTMPEGARWRVEHTQIVDPADIPRYGALGVIPSMQPSHAIGDLHFAVDRLGAERLEGGYAWRSLIDAGAMIAGGSDAPVEVGDPRIEFHAVTQRTDLKGYSEPVWRPEERVNPHEALRMFTLWPAFAAFQEDQLGTIEVGKLADFSIFDGPLTAGEAMSANPVMTVVNGDIVWER